MFGDKSGNKTQAGQPLLERASDRGPRRRITRQALFLAAVASVAFIASVAAQDAVTVDPKHYKVEFENDTAGRLFYETLSQTRSSGARRESKTEVSIPVVFSHKHRVADGENIAFNQGVRRCDTNGDGKITELEARIFSESVSKHP